VKTYKIESVSKKWACRNFLKGVICKCNIIPVSAFGHKIFTCSVMLNLWISKVCRECSCFDATMNKMCILNLFLICRFSLLILRHRNLWECFSVSTVKNRYPRNRRSKSHMFYTNINENLIIIYPNQQRRAIKKVGLRWSKNVCSSINLLMF
jgi:hypothetical protein